MLSWLPFDVVGHRRIAPLCVLAGSFVLAMLFGKPAIHGVFRSPRIFNRNEIAPPNPQKRASLKMSNEHTSKAATSFLKADRKPEQVHTVLALVSCFFGTCCLFLLTDFLTEHLFVRMPTIHYFQNSLKKFHFVRLLAPIEP